MITKKYLLRLLVISILALLLVGCKQEGTWNWVELKPENSPTQREGHAGAYDSQRSVVVLFGGEEQSKKQLGDTWEWDGVAWKEKKSSTQTPLARNEHAMAYDPVNQLTVLFGGNTSYATNGAPSGTRTDTWEWNGANWRENTASSSITISPRWLHALAYDVGRQTVVLFGGSATHTTHLNDTWEWNGNNWKQIQTPTGVVSPDKRYGHAMTYDYARKYPILFSGWSYSSGYNTDILFWDGTSWGVPTGQPSMYPPARVHHAMSSSPATKLTVLFGGLDKNDKALNDTWIWDGKDWKNATPAGASNSPSARSGHTLVYDTNRQEYILFGGSNGSSLFRDTWAYRLSGTRYVSTTGSDSGTCLDEKSPCATLNYAIIRAVPGDEIKVASGDYDTSNQNTGSRSEVVNVYQDVTLTGGWDAGFKNQSGLTRIVGSGSSSSPIRSVTVPKGAKVSLQNIEIWNGRSALGGGILNEGHLTLETVIVYGGVASQAGGGIHNKGSMALTNCVINNNRAPNGGGIYNNGGTLAISDSIIDENNASKNGGGINQWAGSLTLSRSIVESNDATSGAGLYLDYTSSSGSPTVTIENSIVSFNQMTDKGGGIYVNYGDLTLSSSTISVNGATVDTATTSGGGLYNEHGNIQMNNTIVAKNVAGPSAPDCAGAATSNDHNLIGDATGCGITKATNDQFGSANSPIDPLFTSTVSVPANYELGANSPAVDAGNPAKPGSGGFACPVNDQHKVSREKHRPCDIGAYEYVK